jgi:hypothetical protein
VRVEDARVVRTVIRDASSRLEWTHYLICDPSVRVEPEVLRTLLSVLIGEPDLQNDAGFPWDGVFKTVSRVGLPVAGGMFPVRDQRHAVTGSAFRIDDIVPGPVGADRFEAPGDYRNLRDSIELDDRFEQRPIRIDRPGQGNGFHVTGTGTGQPTVPRPAGLASIIGLWITQDVLDAIKNTINQMVRPLSSFRLFAGVFIVNWLEQLRNHWLDKNGGGGTFIYCLLRDEPLPAPGAPTPAVCDTFTGRGFLDSVAVQQAKDLVNRGALPASVVSALPMAVADELSLTGANWTGLSAPSRARIACEVLWQRIAWTGIPINQPPKQPTDPINVALKVGSVKLADVSLAQLEGEITLPPVERSMGTPIIESRPLIKQFYCRQDGYVVAELSLGEIAMNGWIALQTTPEFWGGLAIAHVASVLFPPLAAISSHAAILSLELMTGKQVGLRISSTTVFCYIWFAQNAQGVFGPVVSVSVSGNLLVSASIVASVYPVADLLQVALKPVIDHELFSRISDLVSRSLNASLQGVFGAGFPAAVGALGIPIASGSIRGSQNDHVYIEASLGTIPGVSPSRRPIPVNPYEALRLDVPAFQNIPNSFRERHGLHALSLNLSENAMNDLLAARVARGFPAPLAGTITAPQDLAALTALAQPPALAAHFGYCTLEAVTPPNVALMPGSNQYAVMAVDLRFTALAANPISVGLGVLPGVTWTFHLSAPAQLVVGSAYPAPGEPPTAVIDLRRFNVHGFELLCDLNAATLSLRSMSSTDAAGAYQPHTITPPLEAQQLPVLIAAVRNVGRASRPTRSREPIPTPADRCPSSIFRWLWG